MDVVGHPWPVPLLSCLTTTPSRRVYDIVSFLPVGDLELLKADWVKGGSLGVTKDVFLGNMLRVRNLSTQVMCGGGVKLIGVQAHRLLHICREGKIRGRDNEVLGIYPLWHRPSSRTGVGASPKAHHLHRWGISRARSIDLAKIKGVLPECGKL